MHTLWHIQVRLAAAWAHRCLRNDSWDKSLQISSQVGERHAPKSEIDIYFEEDCVEDIENFDILAW